MDNLIKLVKQLKVSKSQNTMKPARIVRWKQSLKHRLAYLLKDMDLAAPTPSNSTKFLFTVKRKRKTHLVSFTHLHYPTSATNNG